MALRDALDSAEQANLDLVEISPNAAPPVCRIMDYGKYRFEQLKTKKKPKQVQIKEIKIRPSTDEGDYQVKLRNLIRFLKEGNKAKITVRFRGREMAHQEIGMKLLARMQLDLAEHCAIEQMPKMEGKQLVMLVGPKRK